MEAYRRGHNGPDSKFLHEQVFLSTQNPVFMRVPRIAKIEYCRVLSCSSLLNSFEFSERKTGEHIRRAIEVVITALTRNQVIPQGTEGSNPSLSAKKASKHACLLAFPFAEKV